MQLVTSLAGKPHGSVQQKKTQGEESLVRKVRERERERERERGRERWGERERKMIMIALKQHKQLSFPMEIKTEKSLIWPYL